MTESVGHLLTNLLTAYGYNLYEGKNRARADDLVVRERAAGELSEAASALRGLRVAYQRQFIPPATREAPSPPPERMEQLREQARVQTRLEDLATRIRSMSVPTQDRVWEHFRSEKALLAKLLERDYALIAPCVALREFAQGLRADTWSSEVPSAIDSRANDIEQAMRARAAFLQAPTS